MNITLITVSLIGLDIGTGILAAIKNGTLSSKVAREGLMHKSAYLACILLGVILDNSSLVIEMGLPMNLAHLACGYICMIETMSIIENIALINPELRNSPLLQIFLTTNENGNDRRDEHE